MRQVITIALLASSLLLGIVLAQDDNEAARKEPRGRDERKTKTLVYIARNSPVELLRKTVLDFLQDDGARVASDPHSNLLLINTTTENHERVLAVLQQLDRPPKTLRIQLHLLRASGEVLADVDAASLTGQTDAVLKSIKTLEAKGRVHVANRIELTAIENQPTFLQVGKDVSLLSGSTSVPGRGASSSYRSVAVGTMFKVQARLSGESDIVCEFDFEKSELDQQPADADEEARPTRQGVSRLTHQTTSRIHDGHSLLVATLVSNSAEGAGEAYFVLSASIDTAKHPKQITTLQSSSGKPASKAPSGRTSGASGTDRYRQYFGRLFDKYDLNKDKALDADERSHMSQDYSAADTNKDGLVSLEELTNWGLKR